MNAAIGMAKTFAECFTISSEYNGKKLDVLLVPLFSGSSGWVGPGYWQPKIHAKDTEPPSFKYNTRIYTRKELLEAGAKPKYEYLWMR